MAKIVSGVILIIVITAMGFALPGLVFLFINLFVGSLLWIVTGVYRNVLTYSALYLRIGILTGAMFFLIAINNVMGD